MKEKMTREMAARILHPDTSLEAQEEIGASLDDVNEACRMGAEALRVVREPDPETGLMPCGCGGRAKVWPSDPTQFTKVVTDYEVGCTECAMTTGWVRGKQENAMKVWNTAMGWRGEE